jgi:hypothetical protein
LNKQLETVTDSYIAIGEKEVKNQKRLIKINKKRGRLKAKI